ncbi:MULTISPECIES: hypothetical protein [Thermomonosporaceae]|uniref:hypothetical protein n=1 Tax=Thermomonosporaceae TaxID=2012 RepID=UPI00255A8A25|nr:MULTISPECIES: hypothetical protein [Thermomonosporaceae]MDL4774439.1 hypothetical protein [Actinomadura xylanilytica]
MRSDSHLPRPDADGPEGRGALMTQRAVLVLLLAMLGGLGCGVLLLAAGRSLPEAALGAAGTFAASLKLFHEMID